MKHSVISYEQNFLGCYEPKTNEEFNSDDVVSVTKSDKVANGPTDLYDVVLKSGKTIVIDKEDKLLNF